MVVPLRCHLPPETVAKIIKNPLTPKRITIFNLDWRNAIEAYILQPLCKIHKWAVPALCASRIQGEAFALLQCSEAVATLHVEIMVYQNYHDVYVYKQNLKNNGDAL